MSEIAKKLRDAAEPRDIPSTATVYIAMADYEGAACLKGTLLSVPACWHGLDAFPDGPDCDDSGIHPLPTDVGVYRCTLTWNSIHYSNPEVGDEWDTEFVVTDAVKVWAPPEAEAGPCDMCGGSGEIDSHDEADAVEGGTGEKPCPKCKGPTAIDPGTPDPDPECSTCRAGNILHQNPKGEWGHPLANNRGFMLCKGRPALPPVAPGMCPDYREHGLICAKPTGHDGNCSNTALVCPFCKQVEHGTHVCPEGAKSRAPSDA